MIALMPARRSPFVFAFILLTLACCTRSAFAQSRPETSASGVSEPLPAPNTPFGNNAPSDATQAHMLHTMAMERNVTRQQEIIDDTNQLLDLAKQLKAAVDKSSKDQLSLNVVNKASEIEKLAKVVKEKMRDGQ